MIHLTLLLSAKIDANPPATMLTRGLSTIVGFQVTHTIHRCPKVTRTALLHVEPRQLTVIDKVTLLGMSHLRHTEWGHLKLTTDLRKMLIFTVLGQRCRLVWATIAPPKTKKGLPPSFLVKGRRRRLPIPMVTGPQRQKVLQMPPIVHPLSTSANTVAKALTE
ncbi:hypothetical protein PTI98_006244 [Pleurotus ostreatus]|nr:hypothetical protein PTI98_006244 [Pleurotus ostreatus]